MGRKTWRLTGAGCALILALAGVRAQRQTETPQEQSGGVSCGDPKLLCDQVWRMAATVSELNAQLAMLRAEVLEARLAGQRGLVSRLKTEVEQVSAQQRRLEDQESSRRQELQEIEEHMQKTDLSPEQRSQAEDVRFELAGPRLQEIETERVALRSQEEEIRRGLDREQKRLSELERRASQSLR
ncbi:MAG TPA: hypothetical protein VFA33_19765 [Bryobacteraceae bacterium]|nr:hypothetical protein [Bryobacteraceae bacterium]